MRYSLERLVIEKHSSIFSSFLSCKIVSSHLPQAGNVYVGTSTLAYFVSVINKQKKLFDIDFTTTQCYKTFTPVIYKCSRQVSVSVARKPLQAYPIFMRKTRNLP
jgi:hypothetical protein